MIKIFSIIALLFLFAGCGSSTPTYTIDSPDNGQSTLIFSKNVDENKSMEENSTDSTLPVYHYDQSFDDIHYLLTQSKDEMIKDTTYICIGDSTRAQSRHKGQYLFYEVQENLNQYNVTSYLLARAGHEAKQFNDESAYPTWRDAVDLIPGDGENTIIDYSLGINDYWEANPYSIQDDIIQAISKIQAKKPKTHFVLTMPDRIYHDEGMTDFLKELYIDLSHTLNIPLNNTIEDLMPTQEATSYSWYRDDGFNVHLSRAGQHMVAQFILHNIVP